MKHTWRWFGPNDPISVDDMLQAGVQGVVTALHQIPNGTVWGVDQIRKRQAEILTNGRGSNSGLTWDVVESLPVSEDIKRQTGLWRDHLKAYCDSLKNLSPCGVTNICHNFMPVIDWTRTDLRHELPNGALCMRFDIVDFAAFDIYILRRKGAQWDFPENIVADAKVRFDEMDTARKADLVSNVLAGLPGAEQSYSTDTFHEVLETYAGVNKEGLRRHLIDFLSEVVPVAENLGMTLSCHPDDPPFPLLGLPRIMSSEADYGWLIKTMASSAIGITLCSGSLGVRAENDLPGMMQRLGKHVHFLHLRNVRREIMGEKISFHEAEHLEGETDMVALIAEILKEEARRSSSIPFRPDHGQEILSDLGSNPQPGYPAIGRLKGMAEIRGIEAALSKTIR